MSKLCIIIPCYNEEEMLEISIPILLERIRYLIKKYNLDTQSNIMFVDDGSKDNTWEIIEKYCHNNFNISGIKLSNNRGHQNALLAGMMTALNHFDFYISMDVDLQDDLNAIDEMIEKFNDGYEMVFGVRNDRSSDSFFKKTTADIFYSLMNLLGTKTIPNHADFRLMSKKAVIALKEYDETNLFLRGIVTDMGFKTSKVFYKRQIRVAGKTKYPLFKMLSFAWNGITSFSNRPLRLIAFLGSSISFLSIVMILYTILRYFTNQTVTGWAFLNISIWFLSGVQLLSLGIVGEYIGKIYLETKHRPKFIIEKEINLN